MAEPEDHYGLDMDVNDMELMDDYWKKVFHEYFEKLMNF